MEFRGLPQNGKMMFWRTAGKILHNGNGELERANGVTLNVARHVEAAAIVKLLDEQ